MERAITANMKITQYKSVQILFSDYSGLQGDQLAESILANIRAAAPIVEENPKNMRSLAVFTNCLFNDQAFKVLVKCAKAMAPDFVGNARVGLSPLQRSALGMADTLAQADYRAKDFDSVEEAQDWLASI